MPPKRRETDFQKEQRDTRAEEKRQEYEKSGKPMSRIEAQMARPRVNSSGRLQRGS